jgi:hypothetical protein
LADGKRVVRRRIPRRRPCAVLGHAERIVHKLVPADDKQRNTIVIAKRMIWWFYG